eukprot:11278182-Alexandrium_andersonii.AAC.1
MNACARREPEPATAHHGNPHAPVDKAGVENVALILQKMHDNCVCNGRRARLPLSKSCSAPQRSLRKR